MFGILLVDMQRFFLRKDKDTKKLITHQIKLIKSLENLPIFVIESYQRGETIPELKKHLIKHDSYFFEKNQPDAFETLYETKNIPLIKKLYEKNISDLIITGVRAFTCISETTLGAKKEGYVPWTCDELMDCDDFALWYSKNSDYHKTLKKLLIHVKEKNKKYF